MSDKDEVVLEIQDSILGVTSKPKEAEPEQDQD